MSAEPMATFVVDSDDGPLDATAVAELLAAHVGTDIRRRRATPIGAGVRLEFRVGRRTVPVFVGPAPSDSPDAPGSGRWFVSVGGGMTPLAKMLGGKDRESRDHVADALRSALLAAPGIVDIRLRDEG